MRFGWSQIVRSDPVFLVAANALYKLYIWIAETERKHTILSKFYRISRLFFIAVAAYRICINVCF